MMILANNNAKRDLAALRRRVMEIPEEIERESETYSLPALPILAHACFRLRSLGLFRAKR